MTIHRSKSNKLILLALGILIIAFFYIKIKRNIDISNNYEITTGRVIKLASGGTAGGLQFAFEENKSKYKPIMGITYPACRKLINDKMKILLKHEFPVVYARNNVDNAKILIFEKQYQKFNVEIPSDLKQIIEELSTCQK